VPEIVDGVESLRARVSQKPSTSSTLPAGPNGYSLRFAPATHGEAGSIRRRIRRMQKAPREEREKIGLRAIEDVHAVF